MEHMTGGNPLDTLLKLVTSNTGIIATAVVCLGIAWLIVTISKGIGGAVSGITGKLAPFIGFAILAILVFLYFTHK